MDIKEQIYLEIATHYVEEFYCLPNSKFHVVPMKLQHPFDPPLYYCEGIFNKYCGKDVICIDTDLGSGGNEEWEDSNYIYRGGKAWEDANEEYFIESADFELDFTKRSHYFKAVEGSLYEKLKEYFTNSLSHI